MNYFNALFIELLKNSASLYTGTQFQKWVLKVFNAL